MLQIVFESDIEESAPALGVVDVIAVATVGLTTAPLPDLLRGEGFYTGRKIVVEVLQPTRGLVDSERRPS